MAENKKMNLEEMINSKKVKTFKEADEIKEKMVVSKVEKKEKEEKIQITIHIKESLMKVIDEQCETTGCSRTFLFNKVLDEWMKSKK